MDQSNLLKITFLSLVLIASMLFTAGCATTPAGNISSLSDADELNTIQVFYKLDPRLTTGLSMGERWVSPPTYAIVVADGVPYTIEARVEILDRNGQPLFAVPEWIVEHPEMVTVAPTQANEFKITIQRDGQSTLRVTTPDATKTLSVKAIYQNHALLVEVSQTDG
ncbi:MAG: hypothetical protein EHM33_07140 [Chloroflexi bacterium]|nr:MAG: hypothetical protein EHM33_07140 [Chloroflexota bacterium]